jgi:lysine biosynthesis protein LysW
MKEHKKKTSRCPSCSEKISIGENPRVGQLFRCSVCDEEIEIMRLDPIILDLSFTPDGFTYQFEEHGFWD